MPAFSTGTTAAPPRPAPIRLQFAQKAFIVSDERLLLVRKSESDPFHPGRWEVPGGRLEVAQDLDLDDHIRREVWEEVGLKIDPGPPFHLWQWFMPDRADTAPAQVRVVAAARICVPVTTEITMDHQTPDDHLDDHTWVPFDDLASYSLIPSLRPVMRAFLRMGR
jgi:8-oxo-dGTP pyrophosphatase MutT (NUDIX family)